MHKLLTKQSFQGSAHEETQNSLVSHSLRSRNSIIAPAPRVTTNLMQHFISLVLSRSFVSQLEMYFGWGRSPGDESRSCRCRVLRFPKQENQIESTSVAAFKILCARSRLEVVRTREVHQHILKYLARNQVKSSLVGNLCCLPLEFLGLDLVSIHSMFLGGPSLRLLERLEV